MTRWRYLKCHENLVGKFEFEYQSRCGAKHGSFRSPWQRISSSPGEKIEFCGFPSDICDRLDFATPEGGYSIPYTIYAHTYVAFVRNDNQTILGDDHVILMIYIVYIICLRFCYWHWSLSHLSHCCLRCVVSSKNCSGYSACVCVCATSVVHHTCAVLSMQEWRKSKRVANARVNK